MKKRTPLLCLTLLLGHIFFICLGQPTEDASPPRRIGPRIEVVEGDLQEGVPPEVLLPDDSGDPIFTSVGDCILAPETGPCRASFKRYFFNTSSQQCDTFIYGGCNGNANYFLTKEECSARCNPDTVRIYLEKINEEPISFRGGEETDVSNDTIESTDIIPPPGFPDAGTQDGMFGGARSPGTEGPGKPPSAEAPTPGAIVPTDEGRDTSEDGVTTGEERLYPPLADMIKPKDPDSSASTSFRLHNLAVFVCALAVMWDIIMP